MTLAAALRSCRSAEEREPPPASSTDSTPMPLLGAHQRRVGGGMRQNIFDFALSHFPVRSGLIDFVDDEMIERFVLKHERRVGDGLRLHSLARIHHEQRRPRTPKARARLRGRNRRGRVCRSG